MPSLANLVGWDVTLNLNDDSTHTYIMRNRHIRLLVTPLNSNQNRVETPDQTRILTPLETVLLLESLS